MSALPVAELGLGDSRAQDCAELYSKHRPALVRYVHARFPRVDAEGVVQDTFCRTMRHWATVRELENPWPWLVVTARNIALNAIRDDRTEAVGLRVVESSAAMTPDIVDHIDSTDQLRTLGKAMEALTPLQRQLLTVLLEEGLNGAEAARRLGLGAGAARMHLCRMRARLSERFVALGGRLAVTPLGLLGWAWKRTRYAATRPPKSSLAVAGGFAATSVVAMSLGAVTIALAPAHDGIALASRTTINSRDAAATSPMRVAARSHAYGVRTQTTQVSIVTAPELVSEHHHATVNTTPTKSGTTVASDVDVSTPAGGLHMNDHGQQTHDAQMVACARLGACQAETASR